jgi:hypothetical protein
MDIELISLSWIFIDKISWMKYEWTFVNEIKYFMDDPHIILEFYPCKCTNFIHVNSWMTFYDVHSWNLDEL